MKLKICGIRNQEMIDFCQQKKVDYIGLNFVPTSKRQIDVFEMKQYLSFKKYSGDIVALFMDQTIEVVASIMQKLEALNIEVIQFHGKEDANYLQKMKEMFPEKELWKTFSGEFMTLENVQNICINCEKLLFDGKNPGSGEGIENQAELKKILHYCDTQGIPYGVAGGINGANVQGFKKSFKNAHFLDLASGVEKNKKFDINKAATLIKNFNQ